MDRELKGCSAFEVKDPEKGDVEAIVATFEVVDRDADVIAAGAIKDGAKVKMSSYGHDAVYGEIPVGKGAIHVEGTKAIFRGRVFLSTQRGREIFDVLKEMGADQEWSFGYQVLGSEAPSEEWRGKGAQRILTKLGAFEVSPVVLGAGIGTRTLAVKEADEAAARAAADAEAEAAREAEAKAEAEAEAKATVVRLQTSAAEEFDRLQRNLQRFRA